MERILRIKDVIKITALSNSTIYELIKSNDFPRPKRIGKRAVGWLENDIQNWVDSRPLGGSWELLTNEPF
jgi:prophage regulatory protein